MNRVLFAFLALVFQLELVLHSKVYDMQALSTPPSMPSALFSVLMILFQQDRHIRFHCSSIVTHLNPFQYSGGFRPMTLI